MIDIDSGAYVFARDFSEKDIDADTRYTDRNGLPLGFTLQTGWKQIEFECVALNTTVLSNNTRLRCVVDSVAKGPIYGVVEYERVSSERQLVIYKVKAIELVYRANEPSEQGTLLEINSDIWGSAATIATRVDNEGNKLVDIHIPALSQLLGNVAYFSLGSQDFVWFSGEPEQTAHFATLRVLDSDVIKLRLLSDTDPLIVPLDITLKYTGSDDFIVVSGMASSDAEYATEPEDVSFFDVFLRKSTSNVTYNGDSFPYINGPYKLNFETESSS